jgi:hypothetical protein
MKWSKILYLNKTKLEKLLFFKIKKEKKINFESLDFLLYEIAFPSLDILPTFVNLLTMVLFHLYLISFSN